MEYRRVLMSIVAASMIYGGLITYLVRKGSITPGMSIALLAGGGAAIGALHALFNRR